MKNTPFSESFDYLKSQDKHIPNLISWISAFENLEQQVQKTEMDFELRDQLHEIQRKLTLELGDRVYQIFFCHEEVL